MLRYLSIIFLSLYLIVSFSYDCYSQEKKDSIVSKDKKFYFSIYGGALYSFINESSNTQTLTLTNTPGEDYQTLTYNSAAETGDFSYVIGVTFEFTINKNLSFGTGLAFNKINYGTKSNTTFDGTVYGNASPYPQTYTTDNLLIEYQYSFLSVPFLFNYRINRNKFYYTIGAGASLNAVLKATITETPGMQYGQESTVYDNSYSLPSINSSLIFNCAVFYELDDVQIGFQPEFKYCGSLNTFTIGSNLVLRFN